MKDKKVLIIGAVVVIIVLAGILVAASGGKKNSSSSGASSTQANASTAAPADAVATNTVAISNYAFSPKDITVKVGTTVTWTNKDSVHHSVTADTASADAPASGLFGKGESYSYTFKKAGTYNYHCMPHPYMKASVTVTE